ncbi:MAG: FUSC family protein [Desulfovibrionaceae bacterium]|nr:FUSC family protein [Desulfovibrionaceae bacterium]
MPMSIFSDDRMHKLLFMHIRHAFKTGLAAAVAFGVSTLIGSHFSVWAVISTLIVMQGISVADSVQASFYRFTVMSLGALVGMILLILSPAGQLFLLAEVFAICVLGAYLGRYGNNFTMATTAVCIVLLVGQYVPRTLAEQLWFGVTLSVEVLIGVSSAIIVTALIWPVRLGDTLRTDITAQLEKCALLLDTVVQAFLDHQRHVPCSQLAGLGLQIRSNRERMTKVRKLEAHIYHYEHKGLAIQVDMVENCVEKMRALIDALNEYDERGYDPLTAPELVSLADMMMRALRCLGSRDVRALAPEVARGLTMAVDAMDAGLEQRHQELGKLELQHILQLHTFYLVLRHLSENLLTALYQMQSLGESKIFPKPG